MDLEAVAAVALGAALPATIASVYTLTRELRRRARRKLMDRAAVDGGRGEAEAIWRLHHGRPQSADDLLRRAKSGESLPTAELEQVLRELHAMQNEVWTVAGRLENTRDARASS